MKKLIYKIAIFVLILLFLSNILQFIAPYYWGNPGYSAKIRYLNNTPEKFNAYFFGSSRTFRQIDPVLFDELSITPIKSYNMGYAATFIPESYYLLENFLSNATHVEKGFIFVELQGINSIPDINLTATRAKYFLTSKEYFFSIKVILKDNNIPNNNRFHQIKNYTINYIEKLLGIGLSYDLVQYVLMSNHNHSSPDSFGLQNRGFYSLETEVQTEHTQELINRHNDFIDNPIILTLRKKGALNIYQNNQSLNFNQIHLARINNLISMSENKGYHLIFFLPPKMNRLAYVELLPLFNNIDNHHKIDLGNPDRFPEFYLVGNSFDYAHLNDIGAKLYTLKLAAEFNELLQKDP